SRRARKHRPHVNRRPPLAAECLGDRVLPSATPLRLAVLGDSLSASYTGQPYGAAGDQSWVTQLQTLRAAKVAIHDIAFPGATSNSLLNGEAGNDAQLPAAVMLLQQHQIDAVAIIIGANDVLQDLPMLATNPTAFVSTFVSTVSANLETAMATLAAAGHVD